MRTKLKAKFFILLFPIVGFGQTQIGDASNGFDSDTTISLSKDGTVLAVGLPNSSVNANRSGQVQVYKKTGDIWKLTESLNGEEAGEQFGSTISLNADGSILAVGVHKKEVNWKYQGQVRVYKNTMDVWTQIGDSFNEVGTSDRLGYTISLNADGSTLVIGSDTGNIVYKNSTGVWRQIGDKISSEYSTNSLSSDGHVLAIGNPSESSSNFSGVVRVYANIAETWTQIGKNIYGKKKQNDRFGEIGYKVLLSHDGTTLATLSDYGTSIAKVYRNISGTWVQLGTDIQHENIANNSYASLSDDGTVLAFTAPSIRENSSHVIIYKYTAGAWTQIGKNIFAENKNEITDVLLSGDGLTLAINSSFSYNNSFRTKIQIFDLSSTLGTDRSETIAAVLYPNPASQLITLDLQKNVQLKEVNIYDVLGKLIKPAKKNVIDVSTLSSGTYFFEIITDKGKTTKTVLKN
ncbi:T9SS type A sorting domain-containing protein [Flavobacterium poyangense]|uniref:T9SS type A sorting domain-containing protein n=1 Tax=Flavobacterium poyangense TaxID=2204302 RepID=UPI00141DCCE5|nr:T9SS type A sorting domain-containing protein [Flavobacterium sp. JXAS1]